MTMKELYDAMADQVDKELETLKQVVFELDLKDKKHTE